MWRVSDREYEKVYKERIGPVFFIETRPECYNGKTIEHYTRMDLDGILFRVNGRFVIENHIDNRRREFNNKSQLVEYLKINGGRIFVEDKKWIKYFSE